MCDGRVGSHHIPSDIDPIVSLTGLEDSQDEFLVETSVSPIASPALVRLPEDFPRSPSHILSDNDAIILSVASVAYGSKHFSLMDTCEL